MSRIVRCGLIQVHCEWSPEKYSHPDIRKKMLEKHEKLIARGRQEKDADSLPAGTFQRALFLRRAADALVRTDRTGSGRADHRAHAEAGEEIWDGDGGSGLRARDDGLFYNTAAVIDADGKYLGKYRKHHIPQVASGILGEVLFHAGEYRVSVLSDADSRASAFTFATTGIFRRARAILGLNGAEIVFNPSATVAGLSEYLWELEQPAHAVANGYFVGAINRVGKEAPWNIGEFYGKSYFCNPRGKIIAQASRDKDEVLVADIESGRNRHRCARPGNFFAIAGRNRTAKLPARMQAREQRTQPTEANWKANIATELQSAARRHF